MGLKWERVGDVNVVTLDNGRGLEAQLMGYGATLLRVLMPSPDGTQHDVTLGFDGPAPYFGTHPYFGAVIGRYANRIARARFTLDDHEYELRANEGRNQLHGGLRGFDKVLWTVVEESADPSPRVAWQHVSVAGEEGFPGTLVAQAVYTLSGDTLRIDYSATTDAPTVINLTHHAYWNLASKGSVLDHELQLFGSHFLPVNEELVPTGERRPVAGTPMDFLTPSAIGARLTRDDQQLTFAKGGYDHCWVIDRQGGALELAARLRDPLSGRVMEVSTTQPALQFYSGNRLDGRLHGKGGRAYAKYGGLCLETQHFPDSPNQPGFPSTVLRPGQTYRHSTAYRFLVGHRAVLGT